MVLHVVGRSALARPQSMGSYTVGEHCTVLSFRNYTFASECVQVFSKRYAYQFLHRYTKNRLSETFLLGNHQLYWETISVRQVLPIELGVAAEDRLGITGGLKAIPTAEQVLFQLLRVEIAKSGNSAHKYTPQQKCRVPSAVGNILVSPCPKPGPEALSGCGSTSGPGLCVEFC